MIRITPKHLVFVSIQVLMLIIGSAALGQNGNISNAQNWLEINQDISGFWGLEKETPFRDAAVVLQILGTLDADSSVVANGLTAVQSMSTTSTDYLARKIIAMASSEGEVSSYFLDSLAGMQNTDGGWGYQEGYGSNNLETALALRALKSGLYTDMTVLGIGVGYLQTNQNPDSGWSFVAGDSSSVFFTAHAVLALDALSGDFSVDALIEGGANWLKTQDHPDGGFGTGGTSNPYETGLAMAAIIKGDPAAPEILDATTYLESTQLPNGSWNDDAYTTAMAVYGLNHVGPDLLIATADISLSNPMPSDSEIVTIAAIVRNGGIQNADSILVQVFDGDPDLGCLQLGTDATISTLAAGGDSTIHVDWNTLGLAGDHNIHVLVDPLNEVREPNMLNNVAVKPVHVYFPPELLIDIDGIAFNPPEPGVSEQVYILTTVKNVGELTAVSIPLQVWDGDPDAGGTPLLGPYIIPSISPGSQFTLNLDMGTYFSAEGPYDIHACVDMDNAIREISEINNCNFDTLWVGIQSRPQTLYQGLNLMGLPLQPTTAVTSYDIIPQIPNCNEVDGWNRTGQMWMSAVDIGGGLIIGDDWPIVLRDGFFSRVTADGTAPFTGMRVSDFGCTSLEQGLNIVSIPNEGACYTAYTLIDDISTCVEAHTWDGNLQLWVAAAKIAEGVFVGEDFPVTPGNGYFVKVDAAGDWCTRTCDTLPEPNLPDLLVTPSDIYINPNPATSGTAITFAMNVTNIGGDSARLPRIDMYIDDPDLGGTQLFWGYIPDTLAPGEASGLYGLDITLEGSWTLPIFGIADIVDEIEEMDETNNRASQNLTLVPAAVATDPPFSELRISTVDPDELNGKIELTPLRWWISPIPGWGQSESAAAEITSTPDAKESVPAVTAGSVDRIENVIVGNYSNSSVTIIWFTDGLSDGCVNFGPTPVLGMSRCESGPAGRLHTIVLDDLSAETSYFFEVSSGGVIDNNDGSLYLFTTTVPGAGMPYVLYGNVVTANDSLPAAEVVVSGALVTGNDNTESVLNSTDVGGVWVLNLGNLKSATSGEVVTYQTGDTINLRFYGRDGRVVENSVIVAGSSPQDCGVYAIGLEPMCGDIDGSRELSISDIVTLVDYMFNLGGESLSVPNSAGDVDCSGGIDITDLIYLVDYFFGGGPTPCHDCP